MIYCLITPFKKVLIILISHKDCLNLFENSVQKTYQTVLQCSSLKKKTISLNTTEVNHSISKKKKRQIEKDLFKTDNEINGNLKLIFSHYKETILDYLA